MPFQTPAQGTEPQLLTTFSSSSSPSLFPSGDSTVGPFFFAQQSYKMVLNIGTIQNTNPNFMSVSFLWYADSALSQLVDIEDWQLVPPNNVPPYATYIFKGPAEAPFLVIKFGGYSNGVAAALRGWYNLFSVQVPYTRHDGREVIIGIPDANSYTLAPRIQFATNSFPAFPSANCMIQTSVSLATTASTSRLLPLYAGDVLFSQHSPGHLESEWQVFDQAAQNAPNINFGVQREISAWAGSDTAFSGQFTGQNQVTLPRSQCSVTMTNNDPNTTTINFCATIMERPQ